MAHLVWFLLSVLRLDVRIFRNCSISCVLWCSPQQQSRVANARVRVAIERSWLVPCSHTHALHKCRWTGDVITMFLRWCSSVKPWKSMESRHGSAHTRGLHSSPPLEEEEPECHSLLLAYIAWLCFPCRPVGCCSHSARNASASTHWSPTRTCKSIPFCHQSWSHLRTLSALTCPDTQHFFFCVWKPSHPIPNQKTLSRNQCGRTTQAQGKDSRDRDRKHREETPAGIATANTKLQQKWLEPKCLIQLPCVWKNSPILSPGAVGTSETRLTWRNQKTTDVAKEAAAKRTQEPHADVGRDSPLFSLPHSNLSITSPVRQSLSYCWPTIAFSLGFQRRLLPLTRCPTCSLRQISTVSFFSVRASLRQHEFTCLAYSSGCDIAIVDALTRCVSNTLAWPARLDVRLSFDLVPPKKNLTLFMKTKPNSLKIHSREDQNSTLSRGKSNSLTRKKLNSLNRN